MGAPLDWAVRSLEELENAADLDTFCLMALSPLDGRYMRSVMNLKPFFCEFGLIRYRVLVNWLLKLSQIPEITEVPQPPFSEEAQLLLDAIIQDFSIDDAIEVKRIEKITNHDVKAVDYFLRQKCSSNPDVERCWNYSLLDVLLSSEDINNLSHALALKEAVNTVMFPVMIDICKALCSLATQNAHIPMLSRTHGQPASPTTLGKEMANFTATLSNTGKSFSEIEPHDYISKLFNLFIQFNNVLTDFGRDMWHYISLGYFKQIPKAGEVGSFTMPRKINPIDFENSDGNFTAGNGTLSSLSMKLPISRMLRDLTDSTVLRNLGVGLGHSLVLQSHNAGNQEGPGERGAQQLENCCCCCCAVNCCCCCAVQCGGWGDVVVCCCAVKLLQLLLCYSMWWLGGCGSLLLLLLCCKTAAAIAVLFNVVFGGMWLLGRENNRIKRTIVF